MTVNHSPVPARLGESKSERNSVASHLLRSARGDFRGENGGTLDFGFERFQRRDDDLAPQLSIQFRRQSGIAAGMGNRNCFDYSTRADLLRYGIHRTDDRHRQPGPI